MAARRGTPRPLHRGPCRWTSPSRRPRRNAARPAGGWPPRLCRPAWRAGRAGRTRPSGRPRSRGPRPARQGTRWRAP
ncbi:hypothetical protein C5B73_00310 (plasmid) [Nocardia cyriacigeorgica]|nr:hypothetical protein C5B73_00310 [Nocardia cyriacigeorgica]